LQWKGIYQKSVKLTNPREGLETFFVALIVTVSGIISKGSLKQFEVKINGKSARRFDQLSVIIKLKSEEKCFAISVNIKQKIKSV